MLLRRQIDYVEETAHVAVIRCALYKRRHIFFADNERYYIVLQDGLKVFPTLLMATMWIDANPNSVPAS
jgi:hypothetical protein